MSKKEQEKIVEKAGYLVVCWDPLEIEDQHGFISTGRTAKKLLEQLLNAEDRKMTNEIGTTPRGSLVKSLVKYLPDNELEDVREFHNKFDIIDSGRVPTMLTKRKLQERIECMQEELNEFKAAVEAQDFPEQADALIDLVYFAKGTAVMMGLPWEELWNDVQRANMEKVRGVGKRGHAVDMVKPEGWKKPDGEKILIENGFRITKFTSEDGVVDETRCRDDRRVFYVDVGDATAAEVQERLNSIKNDITNHKDAFKAKD